MFFVQLTPQITGGKKQSDEERGAALFDVRVNLPCWTKPLRGRQTLIESVWP